MGERERAFLRARARALSLSLSLSLECLFHLTHSYVTHDSLSLPLSLSHPFSFVLALSLSFSLSRPFSVSFPLSSILSLALYLSLARSLSLCPSLARARVRVLVSCCIYIKKVNDPSNEKIINDTWLTLPLSFSCFLSPSPSHAHTSMFPHECVAVCCSVLQRVAVCCSVLQCAASCCNA